MTATGGSVGVPRYLRTLFYVIGIYGCFLTQGLAQESIYATKTLVADDPVPHRFKHPLFLVSAVCLCSGIVGWSLIAANRSSSTSSSQVLAAFANVRNCGTREILTQGLYTSISYVGAMACTNYALTQVNYPTQVLVKSAKAVPVIIGGWLMYGKRYRLSEYLLVIVVTASLVLFQYANAQNASQAASHSIWGFVALAASLTFDGMTGPRQDKLVQRYSLSTGEMMLLINAFAAPLGFASSLLMEGLTPWIVVAQQATILIPKIITFVLCGAAGQVFVVRVLRELGSLQLTLITTSRKFLAILLSVVWFQHPLSASQWVAVGAIFFAVFFKYLLPATPKLRSY